MFLQACVILFTGGCLPQCMLGHPPEHTPPQSRHPPRADTPSPSGADTPPPPGRACWEIRSTRGRYTSYWNVILLQVFFTFDNSNHFLSQMNLHVIFFRDQAMLWIHLQKRLGKVQ